MRLLLGVGESVAFPACSKILACNLPEHHRGFANGLIICSLKSGPAVGTFAAGLLMARYGWRPVFVGMGLVALAWIPAWMKWMPSSLRVPKIRKSTEVPLDYSRKNCRNIPL
jgi:MFS family permease